MSRLEGAKHGYHDEYFNKEGSTLKQFFKVHNVLDAPYFKDYSADKCAKKAFDIWFQINEALQNYDVLDNSDSTACEVRALAYLSV